jgi:hypothetical protein
MVKRKSRKDPMKLTQNHGIKTIALPHIGGKCDLVIIFTNFGSLATRRLGLFVEPKQNVYNELGEASAALLVGDRVTMWGEKLVDLLIKGLKENQKEEMK